MVASQFIAPRLAGFSERLALRVRTDIYRRVVMPLSPNSSTRVIDLGVTSDCSQDSNFFEKLYPYPDNITAVGLEDASFLEQEFPGLVYVKADVCELPFPDHSFDIAFCSAVIEHVGSREMQQRLVSEAARVAKIVILTTPNRWFPVEFHTLTPLLHWLPARLFRKFLALTGRPFFARESNLNLLDCRAMGQIFKNLKLEFVCSHQRLWGMTSNLVFVFGDINS